MDLLSEITATAPKRLWRLLQFPYKLLCLTRVYKKTEAATVAISIRQKIDDPMDYGQAFIRRKNETHKELSGKTK